jgi:exosortase B
MIPDTLTAAPVVTFRWPRYAPVLAALAVLLLPTYARMWDTVWNEEAYEYGAVMTTIFWWLVWRRREALAGLPPRPALLAGGATLLAGLFVYYVGRSQQIALFELGSHWLLIAGLLLLLFGWQAVRTMWFPLLFLLFAVPLPGFVIAGMTSHLKDWVSVAAEFLLYHAGYPIARDGVVITIGQYPMLVADACSGLNSIYTLTAMGLLYLHLTYSPGRLRNGLILAAILPMAFVANIVRVIALMLLTYHFGYEAGQGFLHGMSGVVLFVVALSGLLGADMLVRRLQGRRP